MTIKDWKVMVKNKNYINWGKKGFQDALRIDRMYLKERGWKIMIGYKHDNTSITGVRIIKDDIKTKQQAIKYAKAYMRSH